MLTLLLACGLLRLALDLLLPRGFGGAALFVLLPVYGFRVVLLPLGRLLLGLCLRLLACRILLLDKVRCAAPLLVLLPRRSLFGLPLVRRLFSETLLLLLPRCRLF